MLDKETGDSYSQSIKKEQRYARKLKIGATWSAAAVIYSAAFDVLLLVHRGAPNWKLQLTVWTILGLLSLVVLTALCMSIARTTGEIKHDLDDLARLRGDETTPITTDT